MLLVRILFKNENFHPLFLHGVAMYHIVSMRRGDLCLYLVKNESGVADWLGTAVFSKSWCPHCRASKALLSEMGAKFYAIELDQVGELKTLSPSVITFATPFPCLFSSYLQKRK